jgi:hypothetical protein
MRAGDDILSHLRSCFAPFLLLAVLTGAMRAEAFNAPVPVTVDLGPLGPLEISGGADGYGYFITGVGTSSNTELLGTDKSAGSEFLNALVQVKKTDGLVRFNIALGTTTSLTLGTEPSRSSAQTLSTGPLYAATVSLVPSASFKISAGLVGSVEGYESTLNWGNNSFFTTDIFYVENSKSRGITATYSPGPVAVKVIIGDGFDTGAFNFLQALLTYTIDANNSLNIYGATNLGRTDPNAHFYGSAALPYNRSYVGYGPLSAANLVNSTMIGGYYSATWGNFSVVPELQYVYAKVDHRVGLDQQSNNTAAALFLDYQFGKSPWSIGGWGEYFTSTGPDLWFLNPRSKGYGVALSPTWQDKHLFVRCDLGVLHLTTIGDGPGYGTNGNRRNQATMVLGGGVLF